MSILLDAIEASAGLWLLGLSALCGVLLIVVLSLARRVRRQQQRWRELLDGRRGEDLERMLVDHLRERTRLEARVEELESQTRQLQAAMRTAKRHFGLVRYDAFDDVGGAQSFALALFDDRGDGAVVTSLVGRNDCRVYAKALDPDHPPPMLSGEEQEAIERARGKVRAP
jgi:hypothetical protein